MVNQLRMNMVHTMVKIHKVNGSLMKRVVVEKFNVAHVLFVVNPMAHPDLHLILGMFLNSVHRITKVIRINSVLNGLVNMKFIKHQML